LAEFGVDWINWQIDHLNNPSSLTASESIFALIMSA